MIFISDVIRNEIKASGLTAVELAKRCGISEQALHKRISSNNMKIQTITQMSDILNRNLLKALSHGYEQQHSANHPTN